MQIRRDGDENGGSPGRYRSVRYENPNLRFVESAPPEEDKFTFPDQKSFHTSTTSTGDETVVPRVDTAPHGVETPIWGS